MAKPTKIPMGDGAVVRGVLRNLLNPAPVVHVVGVTVEVPECGTLTGFSLIAEDAAHAEELAECLERCPGVTAATAMELLPGELAERIRG